jgi:hypothetical protein
MCGIVAVIIPQAHADLLMPRAGREPLAAWHLTLVWVWTMLALVAIYVGGLHAELDRHVTNRLQFHAIPMALSVMYHGRPHDYTAFSSLAIPFQLATPDVDTKIAQAIGNEPPRDDRTYYWTADDRGMGDYVIAAFTLFGPHAKSLYSFYFVVLGCSVLLFLVDLGWHPTAAAMLIFALGALYTCTLVIPLGNLTLPIFEPASLYEPRVIELLSYVATLHLGLTSFFSANWTPFRRAVVAGQAAILLACYHARSTVAWEIAFVLIAGLVCWTWRQSDRSRSPSPSRRFTGVGAAWPMVCLVIGLALLKGYQHATFNPRYFRDIGARTVWHNMLMGLWVNEPLAEKYQLRVSDQVVVAAVRTFLRASQDPRLTPEWTDANVLGALGGHSTFNWFTYEETARDLYWHIWRSNPRDMLHCYLVDKPGEILRILVKATRPDRSFLQDVPDLGFRPFGRAALALVLPGLWLVWIGDIAFPALIAALLFLFACSLVPGFVFYPVVHSMTGAFATVAVTAYVVLAQAIAIAVRVIWR